MSHNAVDCVPEPTSTDAEHKWAPPLELRHCRCGVTHDLVLTGGTVHEFTILDTGGEHLNALPSWERLATNERRRSFRQYVEFATQYGTIHPIRVDTTPEDHARDFSRAHHLRIHIKAEAATSLYVRCSCTARGRVGLVGRTSSVPSSDAFTCRLRLG